MPQTGLIATGLLCTLLWLPADAAPFVVTSTADSGPGTLRQALLDANANPGMDTITFAIPGAGVRLLNPTSVLPTVSDPVMVDGTTQAGYSGTPRVRLDGGAFPTAVDGLTLATTGCTIRGLNLTRFANAIVLTGGGGHLLTLNFIGTDPSGNEALPNTVGVLVQDSSYNRIGGEVFHTGNLISGNTQHGVLITGSNNVVQGNLIGTDLAGTAALGNNFGVGLQGSGNLVGGTEEFARNVISGNRFDGVDIGGSRATGNHIAGNLIGLERSGNSALPNGAMGIRITANSNRVGGHTKYERNIVSGNQHGIHIFGAGNVVEGNYIGTDADGFSAIGNAVAGVSISGKGIPVSGNLVGGVIPEARNLISGNNRGVWLDGETVRLNQVLGNRIGTDRDGHTSVANNVGVQITGGAHSNNVGGFLQGSGNLVSGNVRSGIFIHGPTSSHNDILQNFIGTDFLGERAVTNSAGFAIGISISNAPANRIGGPGATNLISGHGSFGVWIEGPASSNNVIQANLVGTDKFGTSSLPNQSGIFLGAITATNLIGGSASGQGNVVAGNERFGIIVNGREHAVLGNYVGTELTGRRALPNGASLAGYAGILLNATNAVIGGTAPGAGNLISGNHSHGLHVQRSVSCRIEGNLIGTDRTGVERVGNGHAGVFLTDSCLGVTVGGVLPGARNVISGNKWPGVMISDQDTSANSVLGNYIGLDITGLNPLGNDIAGIWISDGAFDNRIGNRTSTNFISGNNGAGIVLEGEETFLNHIVGNVIGLNRNAFPVGNKGAGVVVQASATDNWIGPANIIGHNDGDGILIYANSTTGIAIITNSIFRNARLGINLQRVDETDATVTPNDILDSDSGPNNLQNFPVITNVAYAASATIQGYLRSVPTRAFLLTFYANTHSDPGGHGEGEVHLGSIMVTNNAAGEDSFTFTYPGRLGGEFITVTAMDILSRDTSEFSAAAGGLLILGTTASKEDVLVRFTTSAGLRFRLEWADSLKEPVSWKPVNGVTELQGTGTIMTVTDVGGAKGGQRYYRLALLK